MKYLRKSLFVILFVLISISFLLALSLQDNDNYKKALELLQMAKDEYDTGNYDKGYEYSEQSKELMKLAEKEYYIEKLIEQVDKYGDIAEQKLTQADELGAAESEDENIMDLYEKAGNAYDEAAASYEQADQTEEIDQAIAGFEKAGEKFEESAKYAGTIISELAPNPDRDEADDLLNQAFTKRDSMLENDVISENDKYDTNIMNALNKAIDYYDNKRYQQSKENSSAAIAYMNNLESNLAEKDEADKKLTEAHEKRDSLLANNTISENDNNDQEVMSLLNKAIEEFDNDEYINSISTSEDAIAEMDMIVNKDKYKAQAEELLDKVEKTLADTENSVTEDQYDIYNSAGENFDEAVAAYDEEDYNQSINLSLKALNLLSELSLALPKYYKVRLIPENRDCFWKIARYYFIYQDAYKWQTIYEKNKQILKDPNNPNLIHPGQVFEIPSIKGEKREGEYDPDKKYPNFNDVTK